MQTTLEAAEAHRDCLSFSAAYFILFYLTILQSHVLM